MPIKMEKLSYKLESFEGPLDLLLHLLSKNKINIYDIQISEILSQYMEHINLMKDNNINIQSEFLEMAARLVYIKTALLLPKYKEAEKLKEELQGELIEYQECKRAAQILKENINLDYISKKPDKIEIDMTYTAFHNVKDLFKSYLNAIGGGGRNLPPPRQIFSEIVLKPFVTVFSRAVFVLKKIKRFGEAQYVFLFEGMKRAESVATFLAVLELIKSKKIYVIDKDTDIKLKLREKKESDF